MIVAVIAALEKNGLSFVESGHAKADNGRLPTMIRIDIPATTPRRTILAVWEDLVNSSAKGESDYTNGKKIRRAEKIIRGGFLELYRGLRLLNTYSSLNMLSLTKILNKLNQVQNLQQVSRSYLNKVNRSHFISSDKVVKLADELESTFTKHFTGNDSKKAMEFLRPQQHKDSHMITFFVGLFTGSFITLLSIYTILASLFGMFYVDSIRNGYMVIIYPVFSMFSLLSLHIFLYGCDLYMWKRSRINHNFIFEFSPGTALEHRDAFLISASLMSMVLGAIVIHLIMQSPYYDQISLKHRINVIPGTLLVLFTVVLFCPFNVFYCSTRFCFLRVIRSTIFSPFYKVLMVDFFVADQLTSQIPLLRHMEFITCYFIAVIFRMHPNDTCNSSQQYKLGTYILSFLPFYFRAMQCVRRYIEEGHDPSHLANAGKYVSAILAAAARVKYTDDPTPLWLVALIISSTMATLYQLYWDFIEDWGLLNRSSKNPWLRDELLLKGKIIYWASIALNFVLRLAWVISVLHLHKGHWLMDFVLATLEIIRRGLWNFYRLENEHLNNVGKFRAVKAVPLPFHDMDSDR